MCNKQARINMLARMLDEYTNLLYLAVYHYAEGHCSHTVVVILSVIVSTLANQLGYLELDL